MRAPLVAALAAVQVVMLVVVVGDPSLDARGPLAAAHAAVLLLAMASWRHRVPGWMVIVGADVLFLLDWMATPSMTTTLVFVACWMRNLSSAAPAFTVPGRAGLLLPVTTAVALPPVMLVTRPDLPALLPSSVLVTGLAIVVATRLGIHQLRMFAVAADAESVVAEREQRAVAARRSASQAAAEDARVLHDTVINTLAALAGGGTAVRDLDEVRSRCQADVRASEALWAARRRAESPASRGLRDLPPVLGIRVRHTGLGEGDLALAAALLGESRLEVLRRATAELVQNAARHSGADEVRVDVSASPSQDHSLVVTVSDDGVGFDGGLREGRGLHRSVVERCEMVGMDVHIASARNAGTSIRIVAHADPGDQTASTETATDANDFGPVVSALVRRAGLLYASGLAVVGLVLAVSNHRGRFTHEYVMVALIAVTALAVWQSTRAGNRLPTGWMLALVPAGGAAFVLSALSVDLGREEPILWQAIGPTGPLVLLLVAWPTRRPALVAGVLYAIVALALAGSIVIDDPQAAAITVAAAGVGLGLVSAWSRFMSTVDTIGAGAVAAQRRAAEARSQNAAREAADRVSNRWREAGVAESIDLLRRIADSRADPTVAATRTECAEEESYLRQLILLDPDLVHLGEWFLRALGSARARGVGLVVRAGGRDVDETTAAAWGRLTLDVVDQLPTGSRVTLSAFPVSEGTQLTLVAPGQHVAVAPTTTDRLAGAQATRTIDGLLVLTATFSPHTSSVAPERQASAGRPRARPGRGRDVPSTSWQTRPSKASPSPPSTSTTTSSSTTPSRSGSPTRRSTTSR